MKIEKQLKTKPAKERANLKGQAIANAVSKGKVSRSEYEIEIVDIEPIEGGVQVFARAWKNGKQIGFGKDGTVDIERFRVFNPPVLVPDPQGDIVRELIDGITKVKQTQKLREDPQEALIQVIEHNLSVMKNIHSDEAIVEGKRGNTTSTFYPNAGTATAPVDGNINREGVDETFSTIRGATGNVVNMTDTESSLGFFRASATTDQFQRLDKWLFGFDIDIGTDAVDSAVLSFFGTATDSGLGGGMVVEVTTATPANNDTTTTFVNGDYEVANYGSTKLATGIAQSSWNTTAYNDFTLNASGEAYVANGIKYFGMRSNWDVDNSFTGTWVSNEFTRARARMADQTGTTNDPKLVVEHSVAAAATDNAIFFGCNF